MTRICGIPGRKAKRHITTSSLLCMALLVIGVRVQAQDHAGSAPAAPGEYERKTIVFLPGLLEPVRTGLSQSQRDIVLTGIDARVSDLRYQRLVFSKETAAGFLKRSGNAAKSGSELERLVKELLVPELTKILMAQKLVLAQTYRSESDRQRFIVQKAKELGVDAGHLEKAFEYSYIAVPVLRSWRAGNSKIIPRLEAGIYWYSIETSGSSLVVAFAGETIAASGEKASFHGDGYSKHPFTTAYNSFCENMTIEIRMRESFRYSSQIIDTREGILCLSIGRPDGVEVDDLYQLYGFVQENALATAARVDYGFVRISRLRDAKEGDLVRSEARAVTARGAAQGMMLEEIPCSSFGIEASITAIPYKLTAGALYDPEQSFMEVASTSRRWAFGLGIGLMKSLANAGLAQTYFVGRFTIGGTLTGATFMGGRYEESRTMLLGGGIGMEKRAFTGPVGLNLGLGFGALLFDSHFADESGNENEGWKFYTFRMGPTASVGLSLWVRPLYQLNAVAEKRWFGDETNWSVENSGASQTVFEDQPNILTDDFAFRVYVSRRFGRSPL
ncbi:MAG: hypothetical protein IPH09_16780 [bacterium]|nr:hypothetical protein [bacterium]